MRAVNILALVFPVVLAGCITSSDPANVAGSNPGTGAGESQKESQLATCEKPLGTASLVEPDATAMASLQAMGLQSPTPALRIMLMQSNCFRVIDQAAVANRRQANVQWLITPNIIMSNPDAGGFNTGGLIGGLTRAPFLSSVAGNVKSKEAETALFVTNARTGEQLFAAQGKAKAIDFGASFAGSGALSNIGAYGNTPEGKVIMSAYADAFNKLVAQLQTRGPRRG